MDSLGRFQIIEEIGRGGFAVVYRAMDPGLDREVALKVLHPILLSDPTFIQRFRREAKALALLRHPNIIVVHEVSEAEGRLYIVMELAQGPSLDTYLREQGPVPWEKMLEIIRPVCAALGYAHTSQVIHRDLKPSNILLDRDRGALLSDFGLARLAGLSSHSTSLSQGILGTPPYIAPEVWENEADGPRSDIYSLGCVVFEMLSGVTLFTGQTPIQVMRSHEKGPKFPEQWAEGVPPNLSVVLGKALAYAPEERYPDAISFLTALEDLNFEAQEAQRRTTVANLAAQWRAEAETAMQEGDWQVAKVAIGRWLKILPDDPAALAARAEMEKRLSQAARPPKTNRPALQPVRLPRLPIPTWARFAIPAALVIPLAVYLLFTFVLQPGPGLLPAGEPTETGLAEQAATETMLAVAPVEATYAPIPVSSGSVMITRTPWDQALAVTAENCDYGGEFESIEAVDEFTVKFTLCYPDPALLTKLAFSGFGIAKMESLDDAGGDSVQMSESPLGTGPFVLKEWSHGESVTFEVNPNYWGEKPPVQTLVLQWAEDGDQRLSLLQSGEADGIEFPGWEALETIEDDPDYTIIYPTPVNIAYIGFNNTIPPFDDERVRLAFAHALDRQRLVDVAFPSAYVVAENFVPPGIWPGYSEGIPWHENDRELAASLLAEAGFDFEQEIILSYRNVERSYLPYWADVAPEIQAQLHELGIRVILQEEENTTFLENAAEGKLGFYLLGWDADYPEATNFYDVHLGNPNNRQFGNLYEDIAAPIQEASSISDPEERQNLYNTVNQLIKDHAPLIPLAHGNRPAVFQSSVGNNMVGPKGNHPLSLMDPGKDTLVWGLTAEPNALWCADETAEATLLTCRQIYEPLMNFYPGTVEVQPWVAESHEVNDDATVYTFYLRQDVAFSDGSGLDANDVVATFASMWDASNPNHTGREGRFEYFTALFGSLLNDSP